MHLRLPVIIFALLFSPASASPAKKDDGAAAQPQRLSLQGERELREIVAAGRLKTLQFGEYQAEIGEFYKSQNYTLAWVRDSRPTAKARAVIKLLQAADKKGLFAKEYDGPLWRKRLSSLRRPHRRAPESKLLHFDLALTACAMRYVTDLHLGRINPQHPHSALHITPHIRKALDFLRLRIAPVTDVEAALNALEPTFPPYRRLVKAVQQYQELVRLDDREPLPVSSILIKPGDLYVGVPRLTRLLSLLGDLPPGIATDAELYADPLVRAVQRFQRRHGLAPDGLLSEETLRQLNTPLNNRLRQLRLALERWRWLPHTFSRPPIIVNIPEFRLYAGDAPPQSVVVGVALKHETPIFASMISEVVFRPPWNVPMSIQRKELVAKIKKNRSYLKKHDFEVFDRAGSLVSSGEVTSAVLKQLQEGRLYLRQRPGPGNSLGLVKFVMPNTYSVYLHGTPSKRGFKEARRDLSHSCIRVEDPEALANWALRDQPEWTSERIRAAMEGTETATVKLTEPIPVFLQYGTAAVTEGGEVRFFEDIYSRDAAEGAAFEQRARLPR